MKNKKGFTLIEVLAVIVLIGVISMIAVTSYSQYITKSKRTAYETAENSMKEAAEGMFTDCMGSNSDRAVCDLFRTPRPDQSVMIPLSSLIENGYIPKVSDPDKQGEFCSEDRSYVLAYGLDPEVDSSNINMGYKTCLSCSNYETNSCSFDMEPGRNFNIQIIAKLGGSSGVEYNGEWTTEDIWTKVETDDPYKLGIKRVEYSYSEAGPWTAFSGEMTYQEEVNRTLYVRAIDYGNNISEVVSKNVRIDRTSPTAEFNITGTLGENDWYTSDVTIGFQNDTDYGGSGIKTVGVDIGSITENTTGTLVTLSIEDNVGHKNTYTKTIKMDKTAPKITFGMADGANPQGTASCEVSISGMKSSPTPTINLTNKSAHGAKTDFTVSCTNNAGVTVTQTHTYTYSICKGGSNTCQYGCDSVWNNCHSTTWSNCAYTVNTCTGGNVCQGGNVWNSCISTQCNTCSSCYRTVPNCWSTSNRTCTIVHGGTWSNGTCCLGSTKQYYSCTNCSVCGSSCVGGYQWNSCASTYWNSCISGSPNECRGGNVCVGGYDQVNCSSCYTGQNTCVAGFCFDKNDSTCVRDR